MRFESATKDSEDIFFSEKIALGWTCQEHLKVNSVFQKWNHSFLNDTYYVRRDVYRNKYMCGYVGDIERTRVPGYHQLKIM